MESYQKLKDTGHFADDICKKMISDGLSRIQMIKNLRQLFDFALVDAKNLYQEAITGESTESVDSNSAKASILKGQFPVIKDFDHLEQILKDELEYCHCASGDVIQVLYEVLRAIQIRTDASAEGSEFADATQSLANVLGFNDENQRDAYAQWFIYFLEKCGLIWHGFRITDVWLTEKGRWILAGLTNFWIEDDLL